MLIALRRWYRTGERDLCRESPVSDQASEDEDVDDLQFRRAMAGLQRLWSSADYSDDQVAVYSEWEIARTH